MNTDIHIVLQTTGVILVFIGALWMCVAAYGIFKLPDIFCRAHALTKSTTLGITLILVGVAFHLDSADAIFKVALAIVFQFLTIPVSGHLFARLAYRHRVPRWRGGGEAGGYR